MDSADIRAAVHQVADVCVCVCVSTLFLVSALSHISCHHEYKVKLKAHRSRNIEAADDTRLTNDSNGKSGSLSVSKKFGIT